MNNKLKKIKSLINKNFDSLEFTSIDDGEALLIELKTLPAKKVQWRKDYCKRGHAMKVGNLLFNDKGRFCKECSRIRQRRYYKKKYQKKGYDAMKKTHCRNGHEYTEESHTIHKQGYRVCLICKRKNNKASRERRKARNERS